MLADLGCDQPILHVLLVAALVLTSSGNGLTHLVSAGTERAQLGLADGLSMTTRGPDEFGSEG